MAIRVGTIPGRFERAGRTLPGGQGTVGRHSHRKRRSYFREPDSHRRLLQWERRRGAASALSGTCHSCTAIPPKSLPARLEQSRNCSAKECATERDWAYGLGWNLYCRLTEEVEVSLTGFGGAPGRYR